ncbi:helix-turn-helix transcriptional regulator [Catenulispora rubra]|uniref:helix-turn-helix transcriptional regulator n=1 Tax=Catenulispora rubra TaxID=280293 RepID=UPI00189269DB|nr:AraC family transcriptional regulator [Catenulispora rubra]
MEPMIRNALSLMHERYSDNLTLDDLASAAIMSKFHFIRIFREAMGVTPCRYLSALRLHEAKRLLRSTRMNVSDISSKVGYSSTGSFTRRFTDSVGYSPIQYRNSVVYGRDVATARERRSDDAAVDSGTLGGLVWGSVRAPRDVDEVFVGIFDTPILECTAIASRLLEGTGAFRLRAPAGRPYYVHAVAWGVEGAAESGPWSDENGGLLVASAGPFTAPSEVVTRVELELVPHGWGRPPVLLSLSQARRKVLTRRTVRPRTPIGCVARPAGESGTLVAAFADAVA